MKYWALGNEIDGWWQLGQKSAEEYSKFALEAAKAMRACLPVGESGGAIVNIASVAGQRSVGSSIAFAYLPSEHDVGTEVAVEIFDTWVEGVVSADPLFDPEGARIRA